MISLEQAYNIMCDMLDNEQGYSIKSIMLMDDGYLFSLQMDSFPDCEYVGSLLFKVSGEDGKITGYSPVTNPEEFKKALNNVIKNPTLKRITSSHPTNSDKNTITARKSISSFEGSERTQSTTTSWTTTRDFGYSCSVITKVEE